MKKVAGIMLAVVMMGVLLSGCYTKSCEQPVQHSYKGEG